MWSLAIQEECLEYCQAFSKIYLLYINALAIMFCVIKLKVLNRNPKGHFLGKGAQFGA